jgi:hypothetical protein
MYEVMDGGGEDDDRTGWDYSLTDYVMDGGAEDDTLMEQAHLKTEVQRLLDDFKRNHEFMFMKRRDDEDWQELKKAVDGL